MKKGDEREFDSEQQMKQTVSTASRTQFQFTSRGGEGGLIPPPGLKVRPAASPLIRVRNGPTGERQRLRLEAAIEEVERCSLCNEQHLRH